MLAKQENFSKLILPDSKTHSLVGKDNIISDVAKLPRWPA
jgi:hypothetical protein